MSTFTWIGAIVVALAIDAGQRSATPPDPPLHHIVTVKGQHLSVRVGTTTAAVRPGGSVSLVAEITPGPKIHVYSPEQKGYTPVRLTIDDAAGVTLAPAPRYPPSVPYYFDALQETFRVYSSVFRLTQSATIASRAASPVTIAGTLSYQACDDTVCFRPETLTLRWTLPIVTRSPRD